MRTLTYLIPVAALLAAACGGDDGDDGNNPDAGPDAPTGGACGVEATTLSTYPATFSGAVVGAGDDLDVGAGACADERGYYGPYGEDQVIALTGLTAGATYVVELDTEEDLGVYVTTTCAGGAPATGACLLLVDQSLAFERGEFVGPAGGAAFLIVDTADGVTLSTGAYTVSVRQAECTTNPECTSADAPICSNFECVQCTTSFHCTTGGAPVCDPASGTCVAGGAACTGDDAGEPDDGPAAARPLAFPPAGTPTTVDAAVCSLPATESDWYEVTAPAAGGLRIAATWTVTADLDIRVHDAAGNRVAAGFSTVAMSETLLASLPAAGDYYIEVFRYAPMNDAAATAYTLTLSLPECSTAFDCTTAGEPVCAVGECVAGPAQCTGDDAGDAGTGDDGPAGARDLTGAIGVATSLPGAICNTPGTERDWYRVTTAADGEGLVASLSWTGTADLDVYVYDDEGNLLGLSWWVNPEVVTLSHLPAGTYYLMIANAGAATTAAHAYDLSVTRTAVQTCTTSADCAAVHSTQLYRGACTSGVCEFIPAGARAAGAACDSGDDCTSGQCSYIAFESDAHLSVCTTTCTSSAECASLGSGYACTTGFTTNVCLPACDSDLECGVNANSSTLTTGQPWDYFTCTVATGACSP